MKATLCNQLLFNDYGWCARCSQSKRKKHDHLEVREAVDKKLATLIFAPYTGRKYVWETQDKC